MASLLPGIGEFIVGSLIANGIDRIYCVPGESHLEILNAAYGRQDFDIIVCRHASDAGFMALADAVTGRPEWHSSVAGRGASNAAIECPGTRSRPRNPRTDQGVQAFGFHGWQWVFFLTAFRRSC
jgi:hypothetical protein